MLSLSLYCSSQRISVALYQLKELKVFLEVEIKKNKVTGIFELLKKITKTYDLKKLNYIYFSKGPGSYTTMRSVKAIAQALSTINNSEILAVSTFDLFLNKLEKIDSRIIVCFRSEKSKFFFKFFRKKNKSFINDSEIFHDEIEKLEKIVFSNDPTGYEKAMFFKKKFPNTFLIFNFLDIPWHMPNVDKQTKLLVEHFLAKSDAVTAISYKVKQDLAKFLDKKI